jgi:hypothetical protein
VAPGRTALVVKVTRLSHPSTLGRRRVPWRHAR